MKFPAIPHRWKVSPRRAIALQTHLAKRVRHRGTIDALRCVAGVDLAFTPDKALCVAGIVVWEVRTSKITEQHVVRRPVTLPYIPGLLSFREAPAIIAALRKLRSSPDLFMFDGQGYAHPRRFGLACHVGVMIDRPSVGCAKSILTGTATEPESARGSCTPLVDGDETIGTAVRTRDGVRPVYVSVGHRIDLDNAVSAVLACCTRYRLPEPTRLADQLVGRARTAGG